MPKSLSTSTLLRAVHDETLGFKFGKPDRPSDTALACLLPILRITSQQRQYVTYAESDQVIVSDSGTINRLNVKNVGETNVFLRSGTMFSGKGTQSRALTRSAVLFPGKEVAVDVRCIHASHPIQSGANFEYGGVTPLSVESAFYTTGYTPADQLTMWNSVQSYTASVNSSSPMPPPPRLHHAPRRPYRPYRPSRALSASASPRSRLGASGGNLGGGNRVHFDSMPVMDSAFSVGNDDLKRHFDAFASNFDDLLSKARLHDHQAGVALITERGCKTLELFDVPISWEALHKDAVKRMGTELLRGPDETNVFEYKPERAVEAVRKVLALDFTTNLIWEHKPSNGEPYVSIHGLTSGAFVGEAVEIGGAVAHLVILQTGA